MWPFSKKPLNIENLPRIDSDVYQWEVGLIESDEGPMIIRKNATAKKWAKHASLPIKLGFAIPLNSPNQGGLPDPAENERMDEIEDMIVAALADVATGIQVLTITNGVMKEFVFYVAEGLDIGKVHQQLQADCTTHDVQCIAEREKNWETYAAF
jgi:hypothetical protein